MAATALQMCVFSDYLEGELRARFNVVRWYELSASEQQQWLSQHAGSVHAVVTGGHIGCPSELLTALPNLRVISINGVGVDKVDLHLAAQRNVRVGTTPGTLTEDVADLAVGLTISLLRDIPAADAHVRNGQWPQAEWPLARKVSGRHFGIVGLGQIGLATAARLAAFGKVSYCGPRPKDVSFTYFASVLELARACSVLILTCPANQSTRRLIDANVLAALGPEGYLVNVARGAVVDEPALINALHIGHIAGAALDVYENEPQVPEALRQSSNVVLTPHVASATVETRRAMADLVLANMDQANR
jgi:lactate dehydrogenase-like 2-hydroxyacid dehydrogenase